MPEQDQPFRQAFGARGADVVLLQDLHHAAAHVARHPGQAAEGRDPDGQRQMPPHVPGLPPPGPLLVAQAVQATDRQPLRLHPQPTHQHQRQPECRRRKPHEDQDRGDVVKRLLRLGRRHDPDGQRHEEDQQHGEDVDGQRHRDALGDGVHHRTVVGQRTAEIQRHDAPEPSRVLHGQRIVQAVELDDARSRLKRDFGAELSTGDGGITRREMDHDKAQQRDPEQQRDESECATDKITDHGLMDSRPKTQDSSLSS